MQIKVTLDEANHKYLKDCAKLHRRTLTQEINAIFDELRRSNQTPAIPTYIPTPTPIQTPGIPEYPYQITLNSNTTNQSEQPGDQSTSQSKPKKLKDLPPIPDQSTSEQPDSASIPKKEYTLTELENLLPDKNDEYYQKIKSKMSKTSLTAVITKAGRSSTPDFIEYLKDNHLTTIYDALGVSFNRDLPDSEWQEIAMYFTPTIKL